MTSRLRRFALISTAALLVVAVGLALVLRWVAVRDLMEQTLDSHLALARTLSASHANLIIPLLHKSSSLGAEALAASAEVKRLDDVLIEPLRGMALVRIKIYSPTMRVVYSTEPAQIGESADENFSVQAALAGENESEIIYRDTFNTSDGIIENRNLIESYVPVRRSDSESIFGVFELYSDVTPLLARIRRTQAAIAGGVTAVLGAFYVVVMVFFRRTDRDLRHEQSMTSRYLEQLELSRSNLEERVAARTRELAESEQRFRDVADAAGEFIWEVDREGRFTYLSERVSSVLGYRPDELIGRTPAELMPPEDAQRVRALFTEPGAIESFARHEHRSYTKSGALVWLSVSGVPVRDDDGRIIGHRGANFDITERKNAEHQLQMLSQALEQSAEAILISDVKGRLEYVNPSFTRVSGYTAEEALGRTPAILKSGEMAVEVYKDLWRTISSGRMWAGELYNRSKDGVLYWDYVIVSPLRDATGKVTHYLATQANITDRKQRELALKDSEERLRAIMSSTLEGIITINDDGIIEMCNRGAETLFDYAPGELIGHNVSVLMPEPHRSQHDEYIRRYLSTGEAHIIGVSARELEALRRDGSVFPVELSVSEMIQGGRKKFVGVVRDLTERKRAEHEIETTRQKYFHREKMAAIGQLAAGIIHEVGNPVAAIHGAVETTRRMLDEGDCPVTDCVVLGDVRAGLDTMAQQVTRLMGITREVSEVATPRPSTWQLLDPNEVVRDAVRLLRYDRRFDDIKLELALDPQLPAVFGSPDQLIQVIFNLLVNAEDACEGMAPGEASIRIVTMPEKTGIRLSVEDNGCGMDDAALAQAFDAYFTTKSSGSGLGLGLSLCHSIVVEHGGTCSIESSPARGTTVSVNLPFNSPDDREVGAR